MKNKDYTKDDELMKILSELAHEIEGYRYTTKSHWSTQKGVVKIRKDLLNEKIETLRDYFIETD